MTGLLDIARQAGVSPSTVSRVVNGKEHISTKVRERILALVDQAGYVPNKAAQAMVLQRSFTVGLVIPQTLTVFQSRLFSLIERRLHCCGYYPLFFFDGKKDCAAAIKSKRPDGLILFHEINDPGFYEYLSASRIPAVAGIENSGGVPAVTVENKDAAFEAVRYLIRLGHKRIALLCGGDSLFAVRRAEGYYAALEKSGVPFDKSLEVREPYHALEDGKNGIKKLLLQSKDFTALFAVTDELAIGAVRALADKGIRVPRDISVAGFDDIVMAGYMIPSLTTIHQPVDKLCEQIVLSLHKQITGGGTGEKKLTLPHKLIFRESVRAAP